MCNRVDEEGRASGGQGPGARGTRYRRELCIARAVVSRRKAAEILPLRGGAQTQSQRAVQDGNGFLGQWP